MMENWVRKKNQIIFMKEMVDQIVFIINGISDFFGELNKSVNELIYKNIFVVGDEFDLGIKCCYLSIDVF